MKIRSLQYGQALSLGALAKGFPSKKAKQALRRSFAKKLVELRGVPMKLSQILSMGNNEEVSLAQKEAIQDIEPMAFEFVEKYLQGSAQELILDIESIQEQGVAASLGQVHKAKLKNQDDIAIKIKYPDIQAHMNMDNALFGLVTKTFNNFKEGFSLQDYQSVIRKELEGELDYFAEAKNQAKIYQIFKKNENIIIPQVFLENSKENHITMSWEGGHSIDEFLKVSDKKQKVTAVNLFLDFYLQTIFQNNIIHADPNRGNFAFRLDKENIQLVVYDFGSVIAFDEKKSLSLLKIMQLVKKGKGDLLPWLANIGFDPEMLLPLHKSLLAFCELLFEPLLSDRRYDLSSWNRKERAQDILGENRWNFMVAANAELLPFMRAMQGMFYYISQLDVGIYAWPKIEKLLHFYKNELKELEPAKIKIEEEDCAMAKSLHIEVIEKGVKKVALSFPRRSIENLEDIIPSDVSEKLKEQDIEIDDIVKKSRQTGYVPMDLFKVKSGEKDINVSMR